MTVVDIGLSPADVAAAVTTLDSAGIYAAIWEANDQYAVIRVYTDSVDRVKSLLGGKIRCIIGVSNEKTS